MAPGNAAPCERTAAKSQNDQQYACQNTSRNKRRFHNEINGEPGWIRTSDQQLRRRQKIRKSQGTFSHVLGLRPY